MDDSIMLFTPAAVLDLLSQLPELADKQLELEEHGDGKLTLTVDGAQYTVTPEQPAEIEVPDEDVDYALATNDAAYESIEGIEQESQEPISSGLLKHAVKAMLLGGMIKLTSKFLKD
ncbi:hypothetical protein [uncultured Duncaniella sp.]|uniref:hypothetical protein n=1 Tax=uncultured Duncaniella sp. TaxID=2768039 RepID=UPI002620A8B4|nr:hypothetical protein [uncultured Duncaniella sp.]